MNALLISTIIAAFLSGFFASIIATGPVTFLAFRHALFGKYKKGTLIILGSAIMESIYCSFALTIVGVVLLNHSKIFILSQILTIGILFLIGIYLIRMNYNHRVSVNVEVLSIKENVRSFFTGIILVAINPTVILTWSAVSTALISFGIISITSLFDIVLFASVAGFGTVCGGLLMILMVKEHKVRFSEHVIVIILRIAGIVVIGLSVYSLFKLLGFVR